VTEAGVPCVFVLNQAKGNASLTIQTMAALSEHGQVFPTLIHDRVDYAVSITGGQTVLELNAGSAAALEIAELWQCVKARINAKALKRALAKTSESTKESVAKKPPTVNSATFYATRASAPPSAIGAVQRGQAPSSAYADLNFKVSFDFRRRFKMRCAQEGLKGNQMLMRALRARSTSGRDPSSDSA
jgi:hypothetical protein